MINSRIKLIWKLKPGNLEEPPSDPIEFFLALQRSFPTIITSPKWLNLNCRSTAFSLQTSRIHYKTAIESRDKFPRYCNFPHGTVYNDLCSLSARRCSPLLALTASLNGYSRGYEWCNASRETALKKKSLESRPFERGTRDLHIIPNELSRECSAWNGECQKASVYLGKAMLPVLFAQSESRQDSTLYVEFHPDSIIYR